MLQVGFFLQDYQIRVLQHHFSIPSTRGRLEKLRQQAYQTAAATASSGYGGAYPPQVRCFKETWRVAIQTDRWRYHDRLWFTDRRGSNWWHLVVCFSWYFFCLMQQNWDENRWQVAFLAPSTSITSFLLNETDLYRQRTSMPPLTFDVLSGEKLQSMNFPPEN